MELEKMIGAKSLLEKLANGINPQDDSEIPSCEVVNQIEVVRALYLATSILGQVIENGGVVGQAKKKAREFILHADAHARLVPQDKDVYATKVIEQINEQLLDPNGKVKKNALHHWLTSIGALERDESTAKRLLQVTEFGKEIGLYTNTIYLYGEKRVLVFTPAAQQFVFDNLAAFLESAKPASWTERYMKPWEEQEMAKLREMWEENTPLNVIADTLGRSQGAVRRRLKLLGLMQ